jgi:hypothetical protein
MKATIMPSEKANDVEIMFVVQRLITPKSSMPSDRAKPETRSTAWQKMMSM